MHQPVRSLTHDEKRAAEAAFRGAPFDPKWSDAARKIYLGISSAVANQRQNAFKDIVLPNTKPLGKPATQESKAPTRVKSRLW
ncbi:MAG: hypothetical protein AB7P17_06080 [Nitrospirales bacterium]|nr:hypothetical protein [Nitrospirales bacterium]